jgi:serine/threonine protein kinase
MKLEEWKQLESVFAAGLNLPEPQRQAFWQGQFRDNPPLRAELELMIRGEEQAAAAGFLDHAAWSLASQHEGRLAKEGAYMAGKTIGNYEIISSIGKGGMGEVYLAKDKKLGREVALKVILDVLNQDAVIRFQDEMRILCKIEHDNVARLYDGGMDAEMRPFMVMEYLRGFTSLRDFLRPAQGRGLPLDQVRAITRQFCTGLAQAHDKGIVHRDVKPENIMVVNDRDGLRVKVIDFGIAIAPAFTTEEMNNGILTHKPSVFSPGTTVYKSPEQLENKPREQIKATADVYSFALVIYEMLTGRLAFPSEVHRFQEHAFPPASSLRTELGRQIDAVIGRALSKLPQDRQPDIRTLADEAIAALAETAAPVNQNEIPTEKISVDSVETETLKRRAKHSAATKLDPAPAPKAPRIKADDAVVRDAKTLIDPVPAPEKPSRRSLAMGLGLLGVLLLAGLGWLVWPSGPDSVESPANLSSAPTANKPTNANPQMKLALFRNSDATAAATNTIWHNGDSVKFKLGFTQDGELYLLNHGSNGALNVLFPHHAVNNGKNRVTANQPLEMPLAGSTSTGGFRLDTQTGIETFYLVFVPANAAPDEARDKLLAPIKSAMQQLGNKPGFATLEVTKLKDWFSQLGASATLFEQQNQTASPDTDGNLTFNGSGLLVKAIRLQHER